MFITSYNLEACFYLCHFNNYNRPFLCMSNFNPLLHFMSYSIIVTDIKLYTTIATIHNVEVIVNVNRQYLLLSIIILFIAPEDQCFENSFCRIERVIRQQDDPDELPKVCW